MSPKRRKRSRKKRDDVPFVLIRPKSPNRMDLPSRLFHPEGTTLPRNPRAKVPPLVSHQPNLSLSKRTAAAFIAAVCLCAGLATIALGLRDGWWLVVLLGAIGICYGLGWVRVAHEGRLPGGRMRLNPWARG